MEDLQNYKGSQMHVTFNVKPKEEKAFYASQKCKMYTSFFDIGIEGRDTLIPLISSAKGQMNASFVTLSYLIILGLLMGVILKVKSREGNFKVKYMLDISHLQKKILQG